MEFSSRLLILIILFTLLLTWYNFSLDWHVTQQFVWWQLIIKIPAPAADYFSEWITQAGGRGGGGHSAKFYMGRLGRKVQPLTHLYIILDRKCTPFVDLLLTNGTPFTDLVQNFASLFTAVNVLSLKYEQITKPECFHNFFTAINASFSPCSPFYWPKWQISLPFHILQLVKSLATGRVPAGDGFPLKLWKKSKSSSYNPQLTKTFSFQVWETELFVFTPCVTAKVNGEGYCLVSNRTGSQHETHIVRNNTLRLGKNSSLVLTGQDWTRYSY